MFTVLAILYKDRRTSAQLGLGYVVRLRNRVLVFRLGGFGSGRSSAGGLKADD